jgi:hypothetical protein
MSDLCAPIEEAFDELTNALHLVAISMGESPLIVYSASANWQELVRLGGVPRDVRMAFYEVMVIREKMQNDPLALRLENFDVLCAEIEVVIDYLAKTYPKAGI